jgi:hypothetical protein
MLCEVVDERLKIDFGLVVERVQGIIVAPLVLKLAGRCGSLYRIGTDRHGHRSLPVLSHGIRKMITSGAILLWLSKNSTFSRI